MNAWTQADFEALYALRVNKPGHALQGQWVTYGRAFAECVTPYRDLGLYTDRLTSILSRSDYSPGNKALFVGCGFGYLMQAIKVAYPVAKIWGIDNSAWIHANKATEAFPETANLIYNVDVMSPTLLNQIKPFTGGNGKVDWVITDELVTFVPVAERTTFLNQCNSVLASGGKVLHLLVTNHGETIPVDWQQRGYSWLTLAEWAAIRPAHYWLDAETGEVAGGII